MLQGAVLCLAYFSRSLIQHGNKIIAVHLIHGTVFCAVRLHLLCLSVHDIPAAHHALMRSRLKLLSSVVTAMDANTSEPGSLTGSCPAVQRSGYLPPAIGYRLSAIGDGR